MHLYHVHTKINIPSLNKEVQCPREEHNVTVISLLIKRAAVILAEQHGLIQCTMQWRTGGEGLGCSIPPTPRNSKGPPKSCQTQPDCENC